MGLFGKTQQKDPKEQVREWSSQLRKEGRKLERQVRTIQNEEAKVMRSIKQAAKKGEKDVCALLAREVVQSRKAVSRLYASKAQLSSVEMTMKNQLATVRLAGALEKSSDVMKSMQSLIKVPEIQAAMMEMSKEMTKAGIIEEMLEDTMESIDPDTEDMEEDVQREVDKILFELTAGDLGKAPDAVEDSLPVPAGEEEETEDDVSDMQARLEALRS